MRRASIRFRLTAWYCFVLAAGLCVFSVGAWLAIRASFHHAIDDSLKDRVQGVKRFMDEQISALSVGEIRDEFREHSVLGPGGDLFQVSDAEGNWLYRSLPLEENRLRRYSPTDLGEPRFEAVTLQRTPLRLLSEQVTVDGKAYTVQVAAPTHEIEEALSRFRWALFLSVPVLLSIATLGGYWLSRRALAPVDAINEAARSISIENLSERLTVPDTGDELERLSRTLNEMLERIHGAVGKMAQFTADASHELRAPTALIRTTAEIALRKDRPAEDYRGSLSQVLAESERMSHLVDSLLMLARGDFGTEGLRFSSTDLTESISEACGEGRAIAVAKGVQLTSELPHQSILVSGDAQSLRRLFLILIDNAVKYTPAGGSVAVTLHRQDGFARGVVSDTGIGIAAEDLPHIYDRFWRADKARSREPGGAGLGLSIAKWVVESHHGCIEAVSRLGEGSKFQVLLPLVDETRPVTQD